MNAIASEPHIFDTVYNFRDFGGYTTPAGAVRKGLLYRSAHYGEATDADLAAFAKLKMAAILDLRRPAERVRYPNRRAANCTAETLTYGIESEDTDPPHLSFLTEDNVTVPLVHQRMTDVYKTFANDPGHIEVYAKGFDALSRIDGPLVVHCHAGKDRTGLFVALVHHLLGVGAEDMLADYLATNTKSRIDERVPELAIRFTELTGRPVDQEVLHHVYRVEPQYLHAAFAAIKADYGSLDAYLDTTLGVTPSKRTKIKHRLIA